MATILSTVGNWASRFGWRGGALAERDGIQSGVPSAALVGGAPNVSADQALQLDTIWAAVDRRASIIASLPFNVYNVPRVGAKTLATESRLWQLFHDAPNPRMTPFEFWRALMPNHDLRGNAYARVVRQAGTGEALALWPMAADQVEQTILRNGEVWYSHFLDGTIYVYPAADVLHFKNLGTGNLGFAKIEFMRDSIAEGAAQQSAAAKTFGNGGKPTAVLMTDKVLSPAQRVALQERFGEMASGSESRLFVLEADFKYQQLSQSPEQLQLADARRFSVEQFCRWIDCPPVMLYHANATAWGTGIDSIVEGFHKFSLGPLCVNLAQAVRKTVFTPKQRASMSGEFDLDALLRGSPEKRFALYSTGVQNGVLTRDWCRERENLPQLGGMAAKLTAQANLVPLELLGEKPAAPPPAPPGNVQDDVRQ